MAKMSYTVTYMTAIQAIVLGLIQGLTEFLPVSSSGHLVFVPVLFGWADQGLVFDVVVHVGTLTAVVFYFRKKIWQLFCALISKNASANRERRLAWFIVLSIFPAGIAGYFLGQIGGRSAYLVAWSLIGWGIVLGIADWASRRRARLGKTQTDLLHMRWWQVAIIACAQAIALIPGTSRSGISMTAGLFSGLTKHAAAEFSFLMSVPIIAAAGLVKILEVTEQGGIAAEALPLALGFIAAALSGIAAIWTLMKIIQKWNYQPFVWYRILVGVLILLFV